MLIRGSQGNFSQQYFSQLCVRTSFSRFTVVNLTRNALARPIESCKNVTQALTLTKVMPVVSDFEGKFLHLRIFPFLIFVHYHNYLFEAKSTNLKRFLRNCASKLEVGMVVNMTN